MLKAIPGPAAALLLAALGPASAAPPPLLHPTRDVAVTYQIKAGPPGQPEQGRIVHLIWGDAGQRLRVQVSGQGMTALVNFPAHRMDLLIGGPPGIVVQMPMRDNVIPGFALPADVSTTPLGTARVAGIGCTRYAFAGREGTGRACITSDGVVLRAQGAGTQGSAHLVAISVAYGPQPASVFEVPPGYQRMDLKPGRR
jgi:hypothetical protein